MIRMVGSRERHILFLFLFFLPSSTQFSLLFYFILFYFSLGCDYLDIPEKCSRSVDRSFDPLRWVSARLGSKSTRQVVD
jgi:hypothetical protein